MAEISATDRFEIFEQLNLHQRCIDNDASLESVARYQALYWPEATFTVHDLRSQTFTGPDGMKQLYDYAHSVFPLHKWSHSVGAFEIAGHDDEAVAGWKWIVSWKEDGAGTVSTGTYQDRFERRNGVWKCIERISNIDPNWPAELFQTFTDAQDRTFKAS